MTDAAQPCSDADVFGRAVGRVYRAAIDATREPSGLMGFPNAHAVGMRAVEAWIAEHAIARMSGDGKGVGPDPEGPGPDGRTDSRLNAREDDTGRAD